MSRFPNIESERVFSLCGLLSAALRNRMSPERLADIVFISKNLELTSAELSSLLGTYYGAMEFKTVAENFEPRTKSADADALQSPEEEGMIDWNTIEQLTADVTSIILKLLRASVFPTISQLHYSNCASIVTTLLCHHSTGILA